MVAAAETTDRPHSMTSTLERTYRMKHPLLSISRDFSTIPHSTQTEARLRANFRGGDPGGHHGIHTTFRRRTAGRRHDHTRRAADGADLRREQDGETFESASLPRRVLPVAGRREVRLR